MAYMNVEKKNQIAALVKPICKKYGVKATFGCRNHMTLVMNIRSGRIDFLGDFNAAVEKTGRGSECKSYISVNPYWYHEHFLGKSLKFLNEVIPVLNTGNHNRSDIQTDYFDVGFYIDVNIGHYNKPYILNILEK